MLSVSHFAFQKTFKQPATSTHNVKNEVKITNQCLFKSSTFQVLLIYCFVNWFVSALPCGFGTSYICTIQFNSNQRFFLLLYENPSQYLHCKNWNIIIIILLRVLFLCQTC